MRVELQGKDYANVSFANNCRVAIKSEEADCSYNVRWHRRRSVTDLYDEVGRMDIRQGRWGSHQFEDIEQWKVEFWIDDKMVCVFDNHLANKTVILVAKTKESKIGKQPDFQEIAKYCTDKVNEFNCDLRVYFKGSCTIDFSEFSFKPLRLNDAITDMHFGLEKEF